MAIITVDPLTEIPNDVFELDDPANHDLLVKDAFDGVTGSAGRYEFRLTTPGRTRTMGYEFESKDDTHRRRIIVKPPASDQKPHQLQPANDEAVTNTMVTIRMDSTPGEPWAS